MRNEQISGIPFFQEENSLDFFALSTKKQLEVQSIFHLIEMGVLSTSNFILKRPLEAMQAFVQEMAQTRKQN